MRLSSEFTIDRCELALVELARNIADNDCIIPTKSKHAQFGGDAAISQLILSWAQARDPCRIVLFVDQDGTSQIEAFVSRLHGLVAGLCCQAAVSFEKGSDVGEAVKSAALRRLDTLQGRDPRLATRGIAVEIMCADHLGRSAPILLYRSGEGGSMSLRSENEFQAVARRLLRSATPEVYHSWLKQNDINAAGSLIYELFKNTDDHARGDWRGGRLKSSVRGFVVRHHLIARDTLRSQIGNIGGLQRFLSRVNPPSGAASNIQLLEISVLDSGPGYAPRLLQRPMTNISFPDEVEAVVRCFEKNVSVKREDGSGMGLPYILELLRRHQGVMKLRTGHVSLVLDPSEADAANDGGRLRDIGGSSKITSLAPVSGTLVTIILPLSAP